MKRTSTTSNLQRYLVEDLEVGKEAVLAEARRLGAAKGNRKLALLDATQHEQVGTSRYYRGCSGPGRAQVKIISDSAICGNIRGSKPDTAAWN